MANVCVVHLIRAANGIQPFRKFLDSYRRHPAGLRHTLLIIFKGFEPNSDIHEYKELLTDLPYESIFLPDQGFDILPYFRVANTFEYEYFCFLNSFSVILADDWLKKMYVHAQQQAVGVVGATGSWASHRSGILFERGKPSPYTPFLLPLRRRRGPRPHSAPAFELSHELAGELKNTSGLRKLGLIVYYYGVVQSFYKTRRVFSDAYKRTLKYLSDLRKERVFNENDYNEFPSPHLRTNAFLIRREIMLKLHRGAMQSKRDAYVFESGKQSMTDQILRMGLKVLVVGRDGCAYEKEGWPESKTFFQDAQQNLLVADNQTNDYAETKLFKRTVLSSIAWGGRAAASAVSGFPSAGADPTVADVCLVHLVWKPLGLTPLRNFVESYRRNHGGIRHRLVLAFNGFEDEAELGEYHEVLAGIEYEWFRVYPSTQDIPVYFAAARKFENRFFCFVNSHSVLLDASWLAKLYGQITRAGVGLVGATGSWASHFSITRWWFGLPSEYDEWMRDLRVELLHNGFPRFELSPELKTRISAMPKLLRMGYWIYNETFVRGYYVVKNKINRRRERIERLRRFPASEFSPYPAPHLRTNAFMISRELMLDLKGGDMPTKDAAYMFESGKNGLTAQVMQRRLKVLVVGRDGHGYEEDEWPISNTFWQSQQENLLVSDNNTRQYADGDATQKKFLCRFAWGWEAVLPGEAANRTHLSRSAWEPQAAPSSQTNRAGNA